MELIHSEDRDQFKLQLNWRSALPQDAADITLEQALQPGTVPCSARDNVCQQQFNNVKIHIFLKTLKTYVVFDTTQSVRRQ